MTLKFRGISGIVDCWNCQENLNETEQRLHAHSGVFYQLIPPLDVMLTVFGPHVATLFFENNWLRESVVFSCYICSIDDR